MSDDKKVIHVKDLVIKADNVHIQPSRSRRDPFFGSRPSRDMDRYKESDDKEDFRDRESSSEGRRDHRPRFWF